ncbi:biotin--[acetyl-CoA-carboxylase] ligase [Cumulibacter manganitolerans]|uniref:biotin--[acetyl-CoA-carboxylase] ligase n=1 Tax=Cumulibacter manganitolerans TaxID=1884992 RepID=UPI0012959E66|nr:biotin--[acetyl-CoA-carboxylase] ligase [Cumulibacter manganitolerans]
MIDADAVRRGLDSFWQELQVVAETGSTNDDVLALAAEGAPQGLVRVAEFQTAGRGRLSRTWQAPPGSSAMFTMLLRPTTPVARWGWIPLIAGLGVYDALLAAGAEVALKWPNDVQLGDDRRKCGGILTQATTGAVVVGIGLNVVPHDGLPSTAAAIHQFWDAPREDILRAVLNGIGRRYGAWEAAGGDVARSGLLAAYRSACGTIGRRVRVLLPGPPPAASGQGAEAGTEHAVEGDAVGVDEDGRLVVETASGPLVVGAGDVVHVRPA